MMRRAVLQRARRAAASASAAPSAPLPSEAPVVVVGGGSLGASTLYHLARLGVTDAVLLEKDELTAGTTWHSAGLVWRLRPNDVDIQLLAHTRELARGILEEESGHSCGWVEHGGLFLASTEERMEEYRRLRTLGLAFGIDSEVLAPADITRVHPLITGEGLVGGLFSPGDGSVEPSGITTAYAKSARRRGCKVITRCPVREILTEGEGGGRKVVGVRTPYGDIRTEHVINCGGVWAPKLAASVGVALPLVAMRHAFCLTEPMAGLRGCPNVRDHDRSLYLRVQGDRCQVGGYEPNPLFWDDVRDDFAFGLFELDWDVFGVHMEHGIEICPSLAETGVSNEVCGPEAFTPDHKPLMGPIPGLQGFWVNCGYNSSGMMLGGGCGWQMAEWVVNGQPSLPMFSYDVRRFHPDQAGSSSYVRERSREAYAKNYSIVFPRDEPLAGRACRRGPLHAPLSARGCVWQHRHGTERPGFFLPENPAAGELRAEDPTAGGAPEPPHGEYPYLDAINGGLTFGWPAEHDIVARECKAIREDAALIDISYFGKFEVTGPGALAAMEWIAAGTMDRPVGRTTYTQFLNDAGRVEADLTVTRTAADSFYVSGGGATLTKDLEWLRDSVRRGGFDAAVRDRSAELGIISVQGPRSRSLLSELGPDTDWSDEAFPFSTSQEAVVAGAPCRVVRITFVGELGFELHVPAEHCPAVHAALAARGAVDAGYHAVDSLSAEKGYRHWHEDVRSDDTPLEAGLAFAVKLKSETPFRGRDALERQRADGVRRRLCAFSISDLTRPLNGNEVIYRNGVPQGAVRRAAFAYTVQKSLAFAYVTNGGDVVTPKFTREGDYEIDIAGRRVPAALVEKCAFEPTNERIKGIYRPASA